MTTATIAAFPGEAEAGRMLRWLVMHGQNTQSSFDFASGRMPPQSSRFGKENLFFAILPDAEAREACLEIQQNLREEHGPCLSPLPSERLHVSLYGVHSAARISDDVIFAACRAASAIEACSFDLSFDHITTFPLSSRNAIVLSGNGGRELLRQLHVRIGIEMHAIGCGAGVNIDFQPHATLFYADQIIPRTRLATPVVVPVREFVLLHKRVGEAGYDHVARWPLQNRG
ncbi:2'-5' RNA ligase family protein [Rhizobium sp. S96]|uniref:2'-5' RNA ligase family protein n=1 Tax=Rhizobium sp. S96 TaxID=3055140 RepID=UPI0025AA3EFB|nr:2'-5' RNA ligase family protein [Rhizobium sp. S96]MDM9619410.1 2'-5' RNA ligase [Rhizobium sp. S96]